MILKKTLKTLLFLTPKVRKEVGNHNILTHYNVGITGSVKKQLDSESTLYVSVQYDLYGTNQFIQLTGTTMTMTHADR